MSNSISLFLFIMKQVPHIAFFVVLYLFLLCFNAPFYNTICSSFCKAENKILINFIHTGKQRVDVKWRCGVTLWHDVMLWHDVTLWYNVILKCVVVWCDVVV